ncbi:sigma-70 family RNA polymerase sigma factor [Nocardioides sp. YIM 152315]|uniref:sigma-70 family RNA polymerase sigma factor n=1 Tax=Nocardioides sp. YIM 152315 TaxID=3031760 RepID=UPI0023DB3D43|nr:sigma-70 family RNA polymerase sigma factor [Nocardioides sp. YIM 152315]MDF1603231.1 sigma-70 family RNA polymerase sigma factor [Nocardioides sp. YIM 152315]
MHAGGTEPIRDRCRAIVEEVAAVSVAQQEFRNVHGAGRGSVGMRSGQESVPEPDVADHVNGDNAEWVRALTSRGDQYERATTELYLWLVKIAFVELRRRASYVQLSGPELDDVAHQAAGDAALSICRKVRTFRGECRFTTWAYRFVAFEVSSKVNRHVWNRPRVSLDDEEWGALATDPDDSPETHAEAHDMLDAVTQIVREDLSARQQHAFEAITVRGRSVRQVANDLGSNPNAVYKVMFDARRKLRDGLTAGGFVTHAAGEVRAPA